MNTVDLTISVKVRGDFNVLGDSEPGETVTLTLPANEVTGNAPWLTDTFISLVDSEYLNFMGKVPPKKTDIRSKYVKILVVARCDTNESNPPEGKEPVETMVPGYMFCDEHKGYFVTLFAKSLSLAVRKMLAGRRTW